MQPAAAEVAKARAAVYYALAEALAEPVPGIHGVLINAAVAGARILASDACRRAELALAVLPSGGEGNLPHRYVQVMVPPGRRPVALYESLHRHGRLMGQAALEVEQQYRMLGLAPVGGELPDHASVELAFLGGLATAEADVYANRDVRLIGRLRCEQRRFLRNHAIAWLPELGSALTTAGEPFYSTVGHWLSGFLREEATGRRHISRHRTRRPALIDPAACILCGLCTGRCAANALRIVENADETRLSLVMSRCSGCGRCTAICPQAVLFMAPDRSSGTQEENELGAAQQAGQQSLRRSPRLACPRCGRPTVSQAEMNAVFAQLQLDEAMQRRLQLCVECKALS